MPQLGETVTEGTITKWYKAVGDRVARDEPLFEVSTDKVDSEVPSPAAGVLTAILVEEGDTVDVGAKLAVIGDGAAAGGGGAGGVSAPESAGAAASAAPASAAAPENGSTPPRAETATPGDRAASVADERPASDHTGDPSPEPTSEPRPAPSTGRISGGKVLSPVVRKLLNEHSIDPSTVNGTGLGGRITRSDVEAAIASPSVAAPAAPPTPAAPAPSATTPIPPSPSSGSPAQVPSIQEGRANPPAARPAEHAATAPRDEILPFTNIRRRTAEHMVRSKATSAHTLMVKEIDYERVEQVRRTHGERFRAEEGFGLSYLAFAARAAVDALADFPHLNSSVGDDALIIHHDINLGIAVDLDNEGLIVPVVHNAEELNLRGMARRIRDVAERARNKRLSLDDISGGTFSITNAGPFGTLITGAIINQPQVAILSTDGVSRKPVVIELPDGTESIAIHSVGLVAMTFDHRAVDGAYVARYLARLSEILNDRDWAGEL
jgi:2-oxoglutarate dehydrogenase E2 component (dihydrolipoamide succinyltransferase)